MLDIDTMSMRVWTEMDRNVIEIANKETGMVAHIIEDPRPAPYASSWDILVNNQYTLSNVYVADCIKYATSAIRSA